MRNLGHSFLYIAHKVCTANRSALIRPIQQTCSVQTSASAKARWDSCPICGENLEVFTMGDTLIKILYIAFNLCAVGLAYLLGILWKSLRASGRCTPDGRNGRKATRAIHHHHQNPQGTHHKHQSSASMRVHHLRLQSLKHYHSLGAVSVAVSRSSHQNIRHRSCHLPLHGQALAVATAKIASSAAEVTMSAIGASPNWGETGVGELVRAARRATSSRRASRCTLWQCAACNERAMRLQRLRIRFSQRCCSNTSLHVCWYDNVSWYAGASCDNSARC